MHEQVLKDGDRVQLSELGKQRLKRVRSVTGTIVARASTTQASINTVLVTFDGNARPSRVHVSYLTRIE